MRNRRVFKEKISFSHAEMGNVRLNAVGISMPSFNPSTAEVDRAAYTVTKDHLSFGMLGNDPKFFANATIDEITPKPEDFVEKPFRLLSATTVGAGTYKATDFSNAEILKGSMMKLDGKPMYKDHETDLDNWVGLVNGVKWTEGFTNKSGVKVPAGIDGIVAIDAKTNPKVARGVLMGSVYSNSVTVNFEWVMSHSFERPIDFYEKLGTIHSDGKMIRRVVTKIHDYHESSLVWLGADPFAKAIESDQDLKNIDVSSIYEFTKMSYKKSHPKDAVDDDTVTDVEKAQNSTYEIGFSMDKNITMLAHQELNSDNKQKENTMKNKFLLAFIATFGKQLGIPEGTTELPEDQFNAHLASLSVAPKPEVVQLNAANASLVGELRTQALAFLNANKAEGEADATTVELDQFLKDNTFVQADALATLNAEVAKIPALQVKAAVGEKYTKAKTDEAIRLYKTVVGEENVEEAVVAMFQKADDAAVDGLLKQYTKGATAKFKGHCAECNSEEFTFQSSFTAEDTTDGADVAVNADSVSIEALRRSRENYSFDIGRKKAQSETK